MRFYLLRLLTLPKSSCLCILFHPLQEQGLGHDCELDDVRQPESSYCHKIVQCNVFAHPVFPLSFLQEQGLGHDCELDDVRQAESSEPRRRGRPPKAETAARQAAAAAAAAAAAGDDADGEDEGDGGLGRRRRESSRLQAVLAAAAAVSDVLCHCAVPC
jgi:hypothetical protein